MADEEQERAFRGVWIPVEIWLNDTLTLHEKILITEINSFCSRYTSCFASNEHFAKFLQVSTRRVQLLLKSLEEKGIIERELIYKEGTKEIQRRYLRVREGWCIKLRYPHEENFVRGGEENFVRGGEENFADNNTLSNNTNNKKEIPKERVDIESDFEEVWKLYPRKQGKLNAFKDYCKAVKEGATKEMVAEGIQKYLTHIKVTELDSKYIKQGSTYFHQHSWEDEYEETQESIPSQRVNDIDEFNRIQEERNRKNRELLESMRK